MSTQQFIEKISGAAGKVHNNLSPAELVEHIIKRGEGRLTDTGAIAGDTGEFTGRSPKDKFTVKDATTENTVNWNDINIPLSPENFDKLFNKMLGYLKGREIYSRDAKACADPKYTLNIKVFTEKPFHNLFANNLFIRPSAAEAKDMKHDWVILNVPSFMASGAEDGIRQHNFAAIDFTRRIIIIGGTGYTGEIKKGIFTVLNYVLPQDKNILSMHCSANIGKHGDTAIFFGLSGTGKTTLSADPERPLIGDDEHGWANGSVFNFEGGCYAKCVDLTKEKEPEIFDAIKFGALVENIEFIPGTSTVDYMNIKKTENTRCAYPLENLKNFVSPSIGNAPTNIFFLTADAFGVLPPISKLTPEQAMYYFISGYTAKVAGTEAGVTEPQATFSACFGRAFLPLHPGKYAALLGENLKNNPKINVWLVNTGWSGGAYGTGSRMKLSFTRAMITAALNGQLNDVAYDHHPVFGVAMPQSCPNVPADILNPRNTWSDKTQYDAKANDLASRFVSNFAKYADGVTADILAAAPKVSATNN
jgi:phosphoenolpyruvate carboxykinase (ATP)